MRRKIATLTLAGLFAAVAMAVPAEACGGCKGKKAGGGGFLKGKRGHGKYVTYNGSSFGTAPQPHPSYAPSPQASYAPSYGAPAPVGGMGGYPPPPMMGM